ncbi:MAG TPA: elongation factor G, partial [Ruminococcus sp.]|nr:elongation factor G [Ruminococcus sp.]
ILGVSQGVKDGTICPVFCGDAHNTFAIDQLLNSLTWLAPSAAEKSEEIGVDLDGEPVEVTVNPNAAAAAIVFKTVADPFIGRLSYIKVVSGKISPDTPIVNMRTGSQERITKVLTVCGKKQSDADYIGAGDIGAIPKLVNTKTGDTLCSPLRKVVLDGIDYPVSSYTMAIYPKVKGDEDKVAQALSKLADEDPTIKFETNHETHEMLISGIGEQHLEIVISRLKSKYNVDATLQKQKIAYRET